MISGGTLELFNRLCSDREVQHLQDYANTVSIKRLHYNDHGPVHMRKVALNALLMIDLLTGAGIKLNLEKEQVGVLADSRNAVLLAAISGHMASQKIHSLEAGIILVADGCDMQKGRARIPLMIDALSQVGDIHKYSASAIEKVTIGKGNKRPIRITVLMTESVGFFQVEEILLTKVNSSPAKTHIELYAGIDEKNMKHYL
jgi:metal-dependent HD superfamily phosphatase/phosphodiesterase